MNPLKEYPHYFANGMFSIKHGDTVYPPDEWGIDGGTLCIFEDKGTSYPLMSQVKLIARPISDMTGEEKEEYKRILELGQYHGNPEVWWDAAFKAKLYLLSRELYPFDNSDFGKSVIDKTKL